MISADNYQFLSALLRSHSGLSLADGKEYLLENRLPAVVKQYGLASVEELLTLLRVSPHDELIKAVCEAMTTGETLFFRDAGAFELLRQTLIPLLAHRCREARRPLRIWSAAASTGQEAYSIAILLEEIAPVIESVRREILATDYATHAINRARRGLYTHLEVQRGLPESLLQKYFAATPEGYKISDTLRRRVQFGELNLLHPFASLGQFDLILCRNVLIYFDKETKRDVMERMADALSPGGYFLLGSTETSFGVTNRMTRVPNAPGAVHIRREDVLMHVE